MDHFSSRIPRLILLSMIVSLASGASAQSVTYSGRLQIGMGGMDNVRGFRSNNAVPLCAGGGAELNPGTIGTTLGTLLMNAQGSAAPGPGGALTFHAVDGSVGGAQEKDASTCRIAIPPFANPRLRSRTQFGSAHFPGRKGPFSSMIRSAPVPDTPTATYVLNGGGGYTQAPTVFSWTTMATYSAPTVDHTGAAIETALPFYANSDGRARIQPGSQQFGGGLPFSGKFGDQVGINFHTCSCPPATDYGQESYAKALYERSLFIGSDAKGAHVLSPVTTTMIPPSMAFPMGLLVGNHDLTIAARTPGGSTALQHGAILTLYGGNTVTPASNCTEPNCGDPVISPVAYSAAFFEWTTGAVTHTDRIGAFYTIRRAQGFDVAVAPSTAVSGETRRLQVVTPWSASLRRVGGFGLPLYPQGFGGVAVLDIRVIPAPEPGMLILLGVGLGSLAARSRKRSR